MGSDADRIRAVLTQVDVALFAARLAKPDAPADAVRTALRLAREDLEAILAEARRHEGKVSDLRRRDVLRLGTLATTAAVVPLDAFERIATVLDRPARVDASLLDALSRATASYGKAYYAAEAGDLLGVARGHVNRLEGLARESMSTGQRYRLTALLSESAAIAGWCALDDARRGEARAFFTLARDAAREVGDASLHALTVATIGLYNSPAQGGDAQASAWFLRQAAGALPADAPDDARAWINVQLAEKEAAAGNEYAFYAGMEQVDAALERNATGRPIGEFWNSDGWFSYLRGMPAWRDEYFGFGLSYLGHDDAGDVLSRALEHAAYPGTVASVRFALAQWHFGRSEPVEAATQARLALGGMRSWDARIRALRPRLEEWATLPAVVELDEALALT